jgi:hypothetical protein
MTTDPIFILAWGGRTGSTWLQRMLTRTGGVLIWGEEGLFSPFHLARRDRWGMTAKPRRDALDLAEFRRCGTEADMCQLHPDRADFERVWAVMADELFGVAAAREGYPRWGKKEILWDACHVEWILGQWPEARIIYLYRDFLSVYRSHLGRNCHHGIEHDVLQKWLAHGRRSFDRLSLGDSRERLVRYESLMVDIAALLEWCGLPAIADAGSMTVLNSTQADLPPEHEEFYRRHLPIIRQLEEAAAAYAQ